MSIEENLLNTYHIQSFSLTTVKRITIVVEQQQNDQVANETCVFFESKLFATGFVLFIYILLLSVMYVREEVEEKNCLTSVVKLRQVVVEDTRNQAITGLWKRNK